MTTDKFADIAIERCRVCGSTALEPVLDLGEQFLQGAFEIPGHPVPSRERFPLELVRCAGRDSCGLVQMRHSVPPEILYASYWYRSGTNATMRRHLSGIAESVAALMGGEQLAVLDIGCNDGSLLHAYPDNFAKFGVDPSNIAASLGPPLQVVNTVFPSEQTREAFSGIEFDGVTSIAMFYDLEDPVGFARSVAEVLAPDGVWVLEVAYLPLMLRFKAFDAVCHEHLEYYSLEVLCRIADMAGLRCFKVDANEINGGTIRLYLAKKGSTRPVLDEDAAVIADLLARESALKLNSDIPFAAFRRRIDEAKSSLMAFIETQRKAGKTFHVYGASTKGNVLLQWYGLDKDVIECAADRNPEKFGARTLGTEIPIVSEEESRTAKPDFYLVLPWHFKREFLERERAILEAGTAMIFPLPEMTVITADTVDAELAAFERTNWFEF